MALPHEEAELQLFLCKKMFNVSSHAKSIYRSVVSSILTHSRYWIYSTVKFTTGSILSSFPCPMHHFTGYFESFAKWSQSEVEVSMNGDTMADKFLQSKVFEATYKNGQERTFLTLEHYLEGLDSKEENMIKDLQNRTEKYFDIYSGASSWNSFAPSYFEILFKERVCLFGNCVNERQ